MVILNQRKGEESMTRTAIKKPDFTSGALFSQIILFSLPLIATGILQLLFNTMDTIVVGRWGGDTPEACETALAAVGSCSSIINLIVGLFTGLATGAGVCIAQEIGAKCEEKVKKVVHTSVAVAMIAGVLVTVIGIVFARTFLKMMNTPDNILDEAVPYMWAYFCGMPANMLYNYCAAMMRSAGDTGRPLVFLSVAGVANIILNLIMVLVFHTGALGVGIATAASHWISCILIVLFMMRTDGYCHLNLKKIRIHKDVLKKVLTIGIPAGLQGSLFSLSNVVIQSSVNSLGDVVIAGNTAAANIGSYIYIAQNAFCHTSMTFVGQNVGAEKPKRVRQSILYSALLVTLVGWCVGGTVLLLQRPLLRIFAPENDAVVAAGMVRLTILASTYFLCGLMDVASGALRGFGRSISPMLISLTGSCLLRIVWIATVFRAFPQQAVIYLSYPVSWLITSAVLFLMIVITVIQFSNQIKREKQPFEPLLQDDA